MEGLSRCVLGGRSVVSPSVENGPRGRIVPGQRRISGFCPPYHKWSVKSCFPQVGARKTENPTDRDLMRLTRSRERGGRLDVGGVLVADQAGDPEDGPVADG